MTAVGDHIVTQLIELESACERGDLAETHRLLHCISLDEPRRNAMYACLLKASTNGHVDIVRRLLVEPDVDPTISCFMALRCAREHGHTEVAQVLMDDARFDARTFFNYELYSACWDGNETYVNQLLDSGDAEPSAHEYLIVRWAVRNGREALLRRLLGDARVDVTCARALVRLDAHHAQWTISAPMQALLDAA